MATQASLRQRVLDSLYALEPTSRPARARLAGSVADTDSDTTVAVDDGTIFNTGDVFIEFDDGEQGYVYAVSTNNLTVIRAQNGTLSTAHADNGWVLLNPMWTIKQVDDALAEALRQMEGYGLYQLAAGTELTLVAGQDLYEVTETDYVEGKGVLAVYYQDSSNSEVVGLRFRNVFDFGSQLLGSSKTLGVRLIDWGHNSAGDTVKIVYAQELDGKLGSITEPVLEDLAVQYAIARLLANAEGPRFHDPGRFTDRTVQPGAAIRSSAYYMAQFQRGCIRFRAHLRQKERNLAGAHESQRAAGFRR